MAWSRHAWTNAGTAVTNPAPQSRAYASCAITSALRFHGNTRIASGRVYADAPRRRSGIRLPGMNLPCLAGLRSTTRGSDRAEPRRNSSGCCPWRRRHSRRRSALALGFQENQEVVLDLIGLGLEAGIAGHAVSLGFVSLQQDRPPGRGADAPPVRALGKHPQAAAMGGMFFHIEDGEPVGAGRCASLP